MSVINVPADQSTISAAIAAAVAGDTILVAGGTYAEHGIAWTKANLTIKGVGLVVVDGSAGVDTLLPYTGATIEGLDVVGGSGAGIQGNASNRVFTVRDCIVRDAGGNGIDRMVSGAVVERVTVRDCGGVGINTTADVSVTACEVFDCEDVGIRVTGAASLVEACTALGNGRTTGAYQVQAEVARNVVAAAPGRAGMTGIRATTYDNCLSNGHSTEFYSSPDAGSVTTAPVFANLATRDLRPALSSPVVGVGSGDGSVTLDRSGLAFAVPPSIGAFEYHAPAVPAGHTFRRIQGSLTLNGEPISLADPWYDAIHGTADRSILAEAALVSLLTWSRIEIDGEQRHGWWADAYRDRPIGSGLAFAFRSELTAAVVERFRLAAEAALAWMVEDKLVASVSVTATRSGNRLSLSVEARRNDGRAVDLLFSDLWSRSHG